MADEADGLVLYGTIALNQRLYEIEPGLDFMTDYDTWLSIQTGVAPAEENQFTGNRRFIYSPRQLANYVHFDQTYQEYLIAALLIIGMEERADATEQDLFGAGNPYLPKNSANQMGFGTFGNGHVLALLAEATTRAIKAAWNGKVVQPPAAAPGGERGPHPQRGGGRCGGEPLRDQRGDQPARPAGRKHPASDLFVERGAEQPGPDATTAAHVLNVSFPPVAGKALDGEMLLLGLDLAGVHVSSGSACTSGAVEPSHVLRALGLPRETADATVRFSLGRGTTEADVDFAAEQLAAVVGRMR